MTGDDRWTAIFDRIALFLTLLGFLLREWTPGTTAGAGLNLFIHLLFWVALTLWFAGRATSRGAEYRFTGFEIAFLAFVAAALLSVLRASFRLAALDLALSWLSLGLLFVLLVQLVGRRLLLSIVLATLFTLSLLAVIQYLIQFPGIQHEALHASVEMARRIRTNEPFATFVGPNQLACFLALTLPILAGAMIDRRDYRRLGPGVLLGLAALALTGSKGGGVALASGIAVMAGLFLTRTRGRAAFVGAGVAVTALGVGLLLYGPLLSALARKSHSMHVRAVYWRATGPIIAASPILGVGLDNWQDHYFQTKSDVQQETKKAHNDYLQILAETGIVGALALAGILILGLRKALARESLPDPDKDDPSPWFVASIIALLTLLGVLEVEDLPGKCTAFALGVAWLGAWTLVRRGPELPAAPWTRIGLAGGLVACMVHMTLDFQIYELGIAAALVAVLALIAMFRGESVVFRIPKAACGAATAVLLLLTAPMLVLVTPRVMAADTELDEARAALSSLESGTSANPTKMISDAIRVTESAQGHNPFNPEAYQLFARAKFHEWNLLQRTGTRDRKMIEDSEGMVLAALDNAIQLRPLLSPLHYEKSQAHRIFRRYYLKTGKTSELAAAKAAEHLRLAIEEQRRAEDLYPSSCRNAYILGRLLEIAKDPEAPHYYQEALRLSELAGHELEDLDRLKLTPVAQARCLRAVGKPLEAHDILEADLRRAIQGLPAADARDRLERIVKSYEDEFEEGMTPVLKDVVDAIIRDLK